MQAPSATTRTDPPPNVRQRVRDCCYDYRQHKLSTAEVSVLTNLPVPLVERALQQLRSQDELPLQYLDHRLN
jgi:hypothetical protein